MGRLAWSKVKGPRACLGLCAREQRNWKLLALNFIMRESRRERDHFCVSVRVLYFLNEK